MRKGLVSSDIPIDKPTCKQTQMHRHRQTEPCTDAQTHRHTETHSNTSRHTDSDRVAHTQTDKDSCLTPHSFTHCLVEADVSNFDLRRVSLPSYRPVAVQPSRWLYRVCSHIKLLLRSNESNFINQTLRTLNYTQTSDFSAAAFKNFSSSLPQL
jgi:hypothetical protein